jgi:hypothetical protein
VTASFEGGGNCAMEERGAPTLLTHHFDAYMAFR